MNRIKRLQQNLKLNNLEAILITNPVNIYYLVGFKGLSPEEREVVLIIDKANTYIFVPRMYQAEVKKIGDITIRLLTERNGIFDQPIKHLSNYKGNIGFESDDITVYEFNSFKLIKDKLIDFSFLVKNMRLQKDKGEIDFIKEAVRIADEAFYKIIPKLKPGITEIEVSRELIKIMEELGSEGPSFYPIIASGENTALPHHFTSRKKINMNEPILMDFGALVKGYCSDLTRVIYIGKAPNKFKMLYDLVLKTEEYLLQEIKAKQRVDQIHQIALDKFGEKSKYFIHSTGHGVGLDIHERPYIRNQEKEILLERMAITIEPGLYLEGQFGIRIEDYGIVSKEGFNVLSKAKKDLIQI